MNDPIARDAIAWWVKLQAGEGDAAERDACRRWRAADPRHEDAWARLERITQAVRDIPVDFAQAHLADARATRQHDAAHQRRRRTVIKAMAGAVVLGGTGAAAYEWAPWQRFVADYSTRVGERRRWMLPEGVQLDLASNTAVSSATHEGLRQLTLWRGEMGVAIPHDAHAAPFLVKVDDSRLEAVSARFSLLRRGSAMRVDVYEGSLRVNAQGGVTRVLSAGEALYRKHDVWHEVAAQSNRAAWIDGLLVANGDRLTAVAARLARYRHGIISVSPDAADLTVSGVFPLDDTDRALEMLQHVLPISVTRWGPWWVRVESAREHI